MPLIGVSIAVPAPCGPDLQEYRIGLGDEEAAQIPTHITIAPPREISADALPAIIEHLTRAAAEHRPFEVELRGTGTFRPISPVVFVNLVRGIAECELLAKSVIDGPLGIELDFPYHPHVTIAHHRPEDVMDRAFDELATFSCEFEAASYFLYLYDDNAGWQPCQEFTLGG